MKHESFLDNFSPSKVKNVLILYRNSLQSLSTAKTMMRESIIDLLVQYGEKKETITESGYPKVKFCLKLNPRYLDKDYYKIHEVVVEYNKNYIYGSKITLLSRYNGKLYEHSWDNWDSCDNREDYLKVTAYELVTNTLYYKYSD